MNKKTVIDVNNLTKTYHLYNSHIDRLKETFHPFRKTYHYPFNALTNISFNVKKGETLGIIGRNGSGKSTLLQLICGILQPTSGDVRVNGRISALLELSSGFNPEFTGRQNVYIKSAILGLKTSETDARFDEIVTFADIGDFIDQPVKTYSSGMYVRLAFAVAINVEPQILVVDEALAVGDAAFQYKCFRRIEEMQKKGTTVLLVTHDVGAIKKLCNRAIWLHEGQIANDSDSISVADQYQDFTRKKSGDQLKQNNGNNKNFFPQSKDYKTQIKSIGHLLDIRITDMQGNDTSTVRSGEDLNVKIIYELPNDFQDDAIIGVAINRIDKIFVCGLNTAFDRFETPATKGINRVSLKFKSLPLLAGTYYLSVGLFDKKAIVMWDIIEFSKEFTVSSPYNAEGIILLDHEWQANDK
jgi:ABC-type polysaccharide/polyol phosphate transport system ATPase subunit